MEVIVVRDVQFCEYIKNHGTVIFKVVNYLNHMTEVVTINNGIKFRGLPGQKKRQDEFTLKPIGRGQKHLGV